MPDRRVPGSKEGEVIYECPLCGRVQLGGAEERPYCLNGRHTRTRMEPHR